jgi:hypothetical protein
LILKSPGAKSSAAFVPASTRTFPFIHHVTLDGATEDVTDEIMAEVHELECLPPLSPADLQAARFDHAQDHRKHEVA